MQRAKGIGVALLWGMMLVGEPSAFSQPPAADREVIERLVRVEEGQKQLAHGLQQLGERLAQVEEGQRGLEQRLARVEEGQRGLERRMVEGFAALGQRIADTNQRIDDTNQQISELKEFILWGFGITFAGMFALVGFVIWDRRTALAPAVRRMQEVEEREQRLEAALKEYATKSPELADSLRKMGLL